MRKEIYKRVSVYGENGERTMSLIAEYEHDQFTITADAAPFDHVKIKVEDSGEEIHGVFINFEELEAIYLAAKAERENK